MQIPVHYLPIMPYLIVEKANDFIDFTKKVFDAKVELIVPRSEGVIMHGELSIGKAVIMFCDATEGYKAFPASMFLLVDDVNKTYNLGLQNGAISTQEISERDYGKSAGFLDAFGNQWWLTEPSNKLNA